MAFAATSRLLRAGTQQSQHPNSSLPASRLYQRVPIPASNPKTPPCGFCPWLRSIPAQPPSLTRAQDPGDQAQKRRPMAISFLDRGSLFLVQSPSGTAPTLCYLKQRKSFPPTAEVGRDLWDHLDQQLCAGRDPQSRTPGGLLEVYKETPQVLWAAYALSPPWHPSSTSILLAPFTSAKANRLSPQISPLPPKGRRALGSPCPRNILLSHPPQRLKSNNHSDLLKIPPAINESQTRRPNQKTSRTNPDTTKPSSQAPLSQELPCSPASKRGGCGEITLSGPEPGEDGAVEILRQA